MTTAGIRGHIVRTRLPPPQPCPCPASRRRHRLTLTLAATLVAGSLSCSLGHLGPAQRSCGGVTTVYLVRHAEKTQPPRPDPSLTSAGHARARALVQAMEGVPLAAIYASEYQRTQQTVAPLAAARGITVRVLATGDGRLIARRIRELHRGQRVLAASHSNILPEIITALGVRQSVRVRERDYGDLFVVTLHGDGPARLERRRFGD